LYKVISSASVTELVDIFFKKVTALKLANIISGMIYVNAKTHASISKVTDEARKKNFKR
jgi:hypothetical protein